MVKLAKNKMKRDVVLLVEGGLRFFGRSFGARKVVHGELCFATGMTGYQEAASDPSYAGQVLAFTFPHIGAVGCNEDDCEGDIESGPVAIVLRDKPCVSSSWRSKTDFSDWLKSRDVPGIFDVDVRYIASLARTGGLRCALVPSDFFSEIEIIEQSILDSACFRESEKDLARACSSFSIQQSLWGESIINNIGHGLDVVIVDFGSKANICRSINSLGCSVRITDRFSFDKEIKKKRPDGILLSSGPGNPNETFLSIEDHLKDLLFSNIPIFGICFGMQLLALLSGGSVYKMKQGHRSITHPVLDLRSGKVLITSQNHGFAVDVDSLPDWMEITHYSLLDGSSEGLKSKIHPIFAVQFHPEGSAGPRDSAGLFVDFIDLMKQFKKYF